MIRNIRKPFLMISIIVLVGLLGQDVKAQSNRSEKKFGAHLGLLGDPFPTLLGINLDYNALDFLRVTAGYGSITVSGSGTGTSGELTATTIGAGVRLMVPDRNFTPVAGLSWATVSVEATGTSVTGTVGGFGASASHLYATIGFDWQTSSGFNIGAGYNLSLKSGVGGLPYVNIGWYF
jgi:hypothetical protein